MAWTIPGGIGATGYSDTDDLLARLDRIQEARESRESVILREAAELRDAARLEEIRDLLRPW